MHAFDATYAHNLGLKDSAGFFNESGGSFSLARREYYSYDADLDYLLEVDYNDGLSNEVTTWTYDAAGNRASASDQSGSWTYDNLNRMSASPNHTYSNNILGNTTEINGFDLEWDLLNRLTLMKDGSNESIWQVYKYRADGMRVSQVDDYQVTTKRFRYDGQMPVETASFNGTSSLTWTSTARNVLGARGIDALSTQTSGGTVSTYPLYDTHGNVKAYVKKEASNTWSSLGWKQYNVWGGVRSSSGGAGTTSAYCGNLGHVSDHETGLIYMRARYYAPWAGRFISEDPARAGRNWMVYGMNRPTTLVDPDGRQSVSELLGAYLLLDLVSILGTAVCYLGYVDSYANLGFTGATIAWAGAGAILFALGLYSAAATFKSLVDILGGLSYRAGISGKGDEALDLMTRVKSSPALSFMAHHLEIFVWLGIIDSEGG